MQDKTSVAAELLLGVLVMLGHGPVETPRTFVVDSEHLQELACGQRCRIFGWYAPDGTIYLDNRLDLAADTFARGILVHELTHHIQHTSAGGPAKNCNEWMAREQQAFRVQARWLREHGASANSIGDQMRLVRCLLARRKSTS